MRGGVVLIFSFFFFMFCALRTRLSVLGRCMNGWLPFLRRPNERLVLAPMNMAAHRKRNRPVLALALYMGSFPPCSPAHVRS